MVDAEQRALDEFESEKADISVDVATEDLEKALVLVDAIVKRGHDDLARLEKASGNAPAFTDDEWEDLEFTDRVLKLGTRLQQTSNSLTVDNQNLRSEYGIE